MTIAGSASKINDILTRRNRLKSICRQCWTYSYDTITGEVSQKEVTAVFVRESDHINYLTIEDENGNIQTLEVTDAHPFWVVTDEPDLDRAAKEVVDENGTILYHENVEPGLNGFWVEAKDLREGDVVLGANGELSTVVSNERVECPDGVTVYNFTVEGNHDYFVLAQNDEYGQACVLVHNAQGYGNEIYSNVTGKRANVPSWCPGLASWLYYTPWGTDDFDSRILNMVTLRGIKPLPPPNMEYAKKGLIGSGTGNHQIWGSGPGSPDFVGASGMGPCIGVVIYSPSTGLRAAFHFSQTDDALGTLMQYQWPNGNVQITPDDALLLLVHHIYLMPTMKKIMGLEVLNDKISVLLDKTVKELNLKPATAYLIFCRNSCAWHFPSTRDTLVDSFSHSRCPHLA